MLDNFNQGGRKRLAHYPHKWRPELPIALTRQDFLVRRWSESATRGYNQDMRSIGVDPRTTPDGLADAFRHFGAAYTAGSVLGNQDPIANLSELSNIARWDDPDVQMDLHNNREGLATGAAAGHATAINMMLAFIDRVISGKLQVIEKTRTSDGKVHSELRATRPSDITIEWDRIEPRYQGSDNSTMVA